MVLQDSLLVILVMLVDQIPMLPAPPKRRRGHPCVYGNSLFLKALVIMTVKQVFTVNGFLSILAQPTAEMHRLRQLLTDDEGRFPTRRTWERRLAGLLNSLPAQIACLGCLLVAVLRPWAT